MFSMELVSSIYRATSHTQGSNAQETIRLPNHPQGDTMFGAEDSVDNRL